MNISSSRKNYNPEERHRGLVDDVDTVPGGWDLSSLPAPVPASENGAGPAAPQKHNAIEASAHPRLLWLVDPFFDHSSVPGYPYYAPF